jgi:hypothetical protein
MVRPGQVPAWPGVHTRSSDQRWVEPAWVALRNVAPHAAGLILSPDINLRRSDDTDTLFGAASGPLVAGSAFLLPHIVRF